MRNGPPARLRGVRQGQNSNLLPRVSRIGNGSVLGASAAADSVNCPCQFPTHDDADGYRRDRGSNLSRLSNGFRGSAAIPSARRGAHIELPENELERLNSEGNEGSRGVIRILITQPLHCPRGETSLTPIETRDSMLVAATSRRVEIPAAASSRNVAGPSAGSLPERKPI